MFYSFSTTVLNLDDENADKYLIENIDKFHSKGLHEKFSSIDKDTNVSVYKVDDSKKLKEDYSELIENLNTGLNFFFDKIDDKQDAVNMLRAFVVNLHCDMGFTLSVTALPLCRMERVEHEVKRKVIHTFFDIIKENGMDCSVDDKDDDESEK